MDTDYRALAALAKTYCDAAYEMDADKFASIFHPSCSVTKAGEDGNVHINYRPVHMQPLTNEVQSFPPKARVY